MNPFKDPSDLVYICNATVAPCDVAEDVGEEAYDTLRRERQESSPPLMKFHDRL